VVAEDAHVQRAVQLAEALDQVVSERVVVVDEEDHCTAGRGRAFLDRHGLRGGPRPLPARPAGVGPRPTRRRRAISSPSLTPSPPPGKGRCSGGTIAAAGVSVYAEGADNRTVEAARWRGSCWR